MERKNQRYLVLFDIIYLILMIFTGSFSLLVQEFKSMMQTVSRVKTQVDFIVPRTEEDIKRESIGAAYANALEAIIGFALSMPMIFLVQKYTGERYISEPVVTLLFYLVLVTNIYRSAVYSEVKNLNPKVMSKSFLASLNENGLIGNIAGGLGMATIFGYFVCLNGASESFAFMEKHRLVFIGVLAVALVLILLDATLMKRKWKMDDYIEEN
ncbi:MAG: hypothetical protein K6G88_04585 [Lachnospiraceae bacterium]|nr:hypothetical protein [Lachnospiraceae bacterium]